MGMYDHLRVRAALPDPEYQERTFITKSLQCLFDDYTISADGRLVLREVEWEATPDEEMPYYGTEEWEQGGIARVIGLMREKSARDVTLDDFHGDIFFHATVNAPDGALFAIDFQAGTTSLLNADGTSTPIEPIAVYYKARFTYGQLRWIRRISAEESYEEFRGKHW